MTSAEVVSVVTALSTVAVAIFTWLNTRSIKQVGNKVDDNTKITNEVKTTMAVVKTQTDGMKSELVTVTGLLGEAVGNRAGRAEQKAETEADKNKEDTEQKK